jgi:hypothetical protein
MPTIRIPIDLGQVNNPEDIPGASASVINWTPDGNASGGSKTRPAITNIGFDTANNSKSSGTNQNIIGMYIWKNPIVAQDFLIYVRADRYIVAQNLVTLAKFQLSTSDVTTQLSGSGRAVFAEDSLRLIIAGGGQLQTWTGDTTVMSSRLASYVLGTNQPPQAATHVVKLANYIIANNQFPGSLNQYIWSAIGDGQDGTWPPLNFNTADARPDPVVAVYENLRELYIFGTQTVQVYGVTSDANLPFQSAPALNIGTQSPYSPIPMDTTFAMFDNLRRFVTTDGRSYQVISGPIAHDLRNISTVSDCFGFRSQIGWWDLLIWVFPTEGISWYYELNTQKWGQWKSWNTTKGDYTAPRVGAYVFAPSVNRHFIGDSLYENVLTFDLNSYLDIATNGTVTEPIVAEIVTQRLDYSTAKRKRCNGLTIYLSRGKSSGLAIELSKKDDEGPWSVPTTIDLGTQDGDTTNWKNWYPGGIYRRRQYKIRYSGADDSVISALEEDFTVLTS